MTRTCSLLIGLLTAALCLTACGSKDAPAGDEGQKAADAPAAATEASTAEPEAPKTVKLDFPGTEEGARQLLQAFVADGADTAGLSAALRPTSADFAAVFVGEAAKKAEAGYAPAWDAGALHIKPKQGQSEVLLFKATTEALKTGGDGAGEFPGGYKGIAEQLEPGVMLYRFKFVEPGKTLGMAFDGLAHVNGRWTIFPKPWRVLK